MIRLIGAVFCLLLSCTYAQEQRKDAGEYALSLSADKENAVYAENEPIHFGVQLLQKNAPVKGCVLKYALVAGHPISTEAVSQQTPVIVNAALAYPGWVLLTVRAFEQDGKTPLNGQGGKPLMAQIGAMVAPQKLATNIKEPADFDRFWSGVKAGLEREPLKAALKQVADDGSFASYEVEVDCPGNKPVRGYLTVPKGAKDGTLPALIAFHGAGHKSAAYRPMPGFIRFEFNVHGILNGQPNEYYEKLFQTELKDYRLQGRESRETCYFKGVFSRVIKALAFVESRPEWDGKNLIAMGTSMGGGQAIAAAALDPKVSVCIANDPAIIDHAGALDSPKRKPGWPGLIDTDNPKTIETAGYFDSVFFARRIKCEAYLASGFCDTTCPSSAVFIAFNGIPGRKTITTDPRAGHCATKNIPGEQRLKELAAK